MFFAVGLHSLYLSSQGVHSFTAETLWSILRQSVLEVEVVMEMIEVSPWMAPWKLIKTYETSQSFLFYCGMKMSNRNRYNSVCKINLVKSSHAKTAAATKQKNHQTKVSLSYDSCERKWPRKKQTRFSLRNKNKTMLTLVISLDSLHESRETTSVNIALFFWSVFFCSFLFPPSISHMSNKQNKQLLLTGWLAMTQYIYFFSLAFCNWESNITEHTTLHHVFESSSIGDFKTMNKHITRWICYSYLNM